MYKNYRVTADVTIPKVGRVQIEHYEGTDHASAVAAMAVAATNYHDDRTLHGVALAVSEPEAQTFDFN